MFTVDTSQFTYSYCAFEIFLNSLFWFAYWQILKFCIPKSKLFQQVDPAFKSHKKFKLENFYFYLLSTTQCMAMSLAFFIGYFSLLFELFSNTENAQTQLKNVPNLADKPLYLQPYFIYQNRTIQDYEYIAILFLGGYEFYDFITSVYYQTCDWIMYFHHIATTMLCTYVLAHGNTTENLGISNLVFLSTYMYLTSSIFVCLRFFPKFYGNRAWEDILTALFVVTFLFFRIFMGLSIYRQMFLDGSIYLFSTCMQIFIHGGIVLNLVFLWQIVVAFQKIYMSGKKDKAS